MMHAPASRFVSRRTALKNTACGFGMLAASGLAAEAARAETGRANPLQARQPHHAPRAKRVIFLFMQGGVSHVDSFDYKPLLEKRDGESLGFDDARALAKTGQRGVSKTIMKSLWKYSRYGQSGLWASDLFPEMARHVDKMCFLHSMHTDGVAHGPATLFLHCGATSLIRPSMGSWITYGLGTENQNLPGFVSISPSAGNGGPRNYGNAFLPAVFQGTALGSAGRPAKDAMIQDLVNASRTPDQQQQQFDLITALNKEQYGARGGGSELDAVINSYELAWRMQGAAPEVIDTSSESQETRDLYGIGQPKTDNFGRQCLMARRLCEAGVRYIQVTYGDNGANPAWDQHGNMPKHKEHALAVDQPIAGLLQDLDQRGLLEDTVVWWGGEFGRTPYAQGSDGRDHNPGGFTVWLAGGGVKAGHSHGATDEFGHKAVEGKVHMHDLHATILHLLGLDHKRLTYRYAGRDFRLTDVHGRVVQEILA